MMDRMGEIIRTCRPVGADALRIAERSQTPYAAVDPQNLRVEVAPGAEGHLIVVHRAPDLSHIELSLGEDARLELTELFLGEAFAEVEVHQGGRSECRMTAVQLSSANASYRIELEGRGASSEVGAAFLVGGSEHCVLKLHTAHRVSDCRSSSSVKGVAGGEAVGEFGGLVYVAPDAQRTDARQQSRNMLLSRTARITT